MLHQYASNNGGTVTDRKCEAYDVRPNDGVVICFDLDKNAVRVFNINRIGYVEIIEDLPWKNAASHKAIKVDVFHMTGESTTRMNMRRII